MHVWVAVARWLELLPYGVGGTGALLVLGGLGAHRPLLRWLFARDGSRTKTKKEPERPSLGIRAAGSGETLAPVELPPEPEPEPVRQPEPAVPETVDEAEAESFQELQARLAAAKARRASGNVDEPGETLPPGATDSGPDLQAAILEVARARGAEERMARQRRKAERELTERMRVEQIALRKQAEALATTLGVPKLAKPAEDVGAADPEVQAADDGGPEATAEVSPPGAVGTEDLAERIETLREGLQAGDPSAELELRTLLATLRTTVGALELLSHAAPYLGPECPLDPEQDLLLERALEQLRGD